MKRILGMAVAIAGVLAYSSAAFAATVVFDVSGGGTSYSKSGDANAAVPGPDTYGGPCAPGLASVGYPVADPLINCFRYPFRAAGLPTASGVGVDTAAAVSTQFALVGMPTGFATGSSVSLDITGSSVTMLGGTIKLYARTPIIYGTAVLTTIGTITIAGGATGTLTGDSILWSTPANNTFSGTINCEGSNCSAISHPMVPIPFDPYFSAITNTTPVTALNLGEWDLDALHTSILASSNAINRWSNVALDPNRRVGAYTFGATSLGNPVPEPGTAALMLLGLGALALRSRKA